MTLTTASGYQPRNNMTDLEKLKKAFDDVIWMAARYAHGRSTYAPSMVREAVALRREVDPDWRLAPDQVVKPLDKSTESYNLDSDDLSDIYSPTNDNQ
jgi:hypothetical protein